MILNMTVKNKTELKKMICNQLNMLQSLPRKTPPRRLSPEMTTVRRFIKKRF